MRAERGLSFTRRADQLSLARRLRFPLTDSVQWRRARIGNSTGSENKTRFLAPNPHCMSYALYAEHERLRLGAV